MNKKIDIAIVNTMPVPSGAASVNRILSYSKGLVELWNDVTIYTTSFGQDTDMHNFNGINYKALGTEFKLKFLQPISLIIALIRLVRIFISSKNSHQVIILISNSLFLIYPLVLVSKIKKIKIIQEKSEYPFVLNNKSFLGKLFANYYVRTTYKLFDGLIIMTYKLQEYFQDKINKNCKTIVVPMTVEPERFEIISKNNLGDYIAYCGDIGGNKDGVQNLISAFSIIEKDFPKLKLLLIGGSKNPNERIKLEEYAKKLKCKNIIFYGMVNRDEIPPLIVNAKILALARPSSLQSAGGFPTKLGEYLSTGKPVIVTTVGDIPLYLKDSENAFLVEPDDNEAFAKKIKYILSNYDMALKIAKEGKNLVKTTFYYKSQAHRIEEYLTTLI